ncbi:hypothetical protein FQZ97_1052620 [compost metagenome]
MLQQRHLVHEFVAGTAIDIPVAGQAFALGEDLFDVEGEAHSRQGPGTPGQQAVDPAPQAPAVTARIGQAIDVVDAQAVHQAPFDQLEDLGMGGLEDLLALHPQAAQFIDIEEAPPVDVIGGGAPAGDTVGLAFQQPMQALQPGLAVAAVQRQAALQGQRVALVAGQLGQALLQLDSVAPGIPRVAQAVEALGQG